MDSSSSLYDKIPKLLITTHGQWNVPDNYREKGHPTFKLPYNTRIMYATGMGVVNYLDIHQKVPNMINIEYKKNNKKGFRKIQNFKKDLMSYDLNGCCDDLACKDGRRLNAPNLRDIQEQEQNSSLDSSDRKIATEFLDQPDKPYRTTSKKKGMHMPIKTFSISKSEFGKLENGRNYRNLKNFNDNRIILYIHGHKPIDVLYNWDNDENEPFTKVKLLRHNDIEMTLEMVLARVKKICDDLKINLEDLDIIDLSCNVTVDDDNVKAPKDDYDRANYINELKNLVFDKDEVASSSSTLSSPPSSSTLSSSSSSSSNNKMEEEDKGFFSMLSQYWILNKNKSKTSTNKTSTNKTSKRKTSKKKQPATKVKIKKTRRSYIK